MLASWANTIVIAAFGLGLGSVCGLVRHFTPAALDEVMNSTRAGEGLLAGVRRRQEAQQEIIRSPEARPMRLAEMALFALILVLVLTLWLSPVKLGWWTLGIAFVAGWLLLEIVFRLARAGKATLVGPSFLDPLAPRGGGGGGGA